MCIMAELRDSLRGPRMGGRRLPPVLRGLLPILLAISLGGCTAPPSSAPEVEPAGAPAPVSSTAVASIVEPPPVQLRRNIDFDALRAQNPDIIAWIEVPGTNIDYPVMRTDDNAYYLSHNVRREYDMYGAIFADVQNNTDFTSPVMVVYGHFTPIETEFTQLHRFEDRDFFDANRAVYVYLPGKQLNYEVVSAFTTDDRWLTNGTDYSDPDVMRGFVDWLGAAAAEENGEIAVTGTTSLTIAAEAIARERNGEATTLVAKGTFKFVLLDENDRPRRVDGMTLA